MTIRKEYCKDMFLSKKKRILKRMKEVSKYHIEYYLFTFHWYNPILDKNESCQQLRIIDRMEQWRSEQFHGDNCGKRLAKEMLRNYLKSGFWYHVDSKTTVWIDKPEWVWVSRVSKGEAELWANV